MKNLVKKLSLVFAQVHGVPSAAHYITMRTRHKGTYPYYRELFIDNGCNSLYDVETRTEIGRRFEEIHREISTATRYATMPIKL